jgi:hypothetical protein
VAAFSERIRASVEEAVVYTLQVRFFFRGEGGSEAGSVCERETDSLAVRDR